MKIDFHALEYLREYRTYFHIAIDYGIHGTTAIRIYRWVEDKLIKGGWFALPGKKALASGKQRGSKYEVAYIDVTESPVEHPKRGKKITTREKRNDIP